MRKKQYLVLVIVLAVIVAALFAVRAAKSHKEKEEEKQKEAEIVYAVQFDADEVTAFSYQYEGNTLEFVKTDDTWTCKADESVDVDEDKIQNLLNAVSTVTADSTIENVSDISEYGLDEPTQEAAFVFEDGSTKTMTFGMENQVLGGYYLQVSDDTNVYLVSSTSVTSTLNKSLEDLTAAEEESSDGEESKEETSDDGTSMEETSDDGTADAAE